MTKWIGYHYKDIIVAFNSLLPSEYRYLLYQILINKVMYFWIKHTLSLVRYEILPNELKWELRNQLLSLRWQTHIK